MFYGFYLKYCSILNFRGLNFNMEFFCLMIISGFSKYLDEVKLSTKFHHIISLFFNRCEKVRLFALKEKGYKAFILYDNLILLYQSMLFSNTLLLIWWPEVFKTLTFALLSFSLLINVSIFSKLTYGSFSAVDI